MISLLTGVYQTTDIRLRRSNLWLNSLAVLLKLVSFACIANRFLLCLSLFMEIMEKSTQNNDIVFFEDGSWDAIGALG